MIPIQSNKRHDPLNYAMGDCMRACVASIIESDLHMVPDFLADGEQADVWDRIEAFLNGRGLASVLFNVPGSTPLADVFAMMEQNNPDPYYLLIGRGKISDHMVVCQGGRIVNDPSWLKIGINGPSSAGVYQIFVLTPFYAA